MTKIAIRGLVVPLCLAWLVACGGDPNDAADQAENLAEPSKRIEAVDNLSRLYSQALADHDGNRADPAVKAIADASIEALSTAYIATRQDNQVGYRVLQLIQQMRDPRSIPALAAALDWRREVNESHAVAAAQTLRDLEVPPGKRGEVIAALMKGFDKITTDRPQDQLIAKAIVEALGSLNDHVATEPLTRIAMREGSPLNFLINRLALMQLAKLGDQAAIPAFIKALFFRSADLRFGMEDVAIGGLVRIGAPSLQPLLGLLAGTNAEANAAAATQVAALTTAGQTGMTAEGLVKQRAVSALGALGRPEAFDPILAETRSTDLHRKVTAAGSLLSLTLNPAQTTQAREAVIATINSLPATSMEGLSARAALMSQALNTFDPGWLPFLLTQVRDREAHPDVRLVALQTYAFIANKQEAIDASTILSTEPTSADGGQKERFAALLPIVAAANACDVDVTCWLGKLRDNDPLVIQKAAVMIGRLARGNQQAIDALVPLIGHAKAEVRIAALGALDRIAERGAPAAVTKIDELAEREDGQRVWSQVAAEALRVQNRLRARSGS